jgi:hypothetical protein
LNGHGVDVTLVAPEDARPIRRVRVYESSTTWAEARLTA